MNVLRVCVCTHCLYVCMYHGVCKVYLCVRYVRVTFMYIHTYTHRHIDTYTHTHIHTRGGNVKRGETLLAFLSLCLCVCLGVGCFRSVCLSLSLSLCVCVCVWLAGTVGFASGGLAGFPHRPAPRDRCFPRAVCLAALIPACIASHMPVCLNVCMSECVSVCMDEWTSTWGAWVEQTDE